MSINFDFTALKQYAEVITASSAVLLVLYKFFKAIYLKGKTTYNGIQDIRCKINYIFSELTPDKGGSLKDKVNKGQELNELNNRLMNKLMIRQKWILDNENIIVFESDINGKCIWVNKKYLDVFKRDNSYYMGHGWKNSIVDEDREKVILDWESCIKEGRDYESNYRMTDKTGEMFRVHCIANKTDDGYMGLITILPDNKVDLHDDHKHVDDCY